MTESQTFELLKRKRKSLRSAVTKAVSDLENELKNTDLNAANLEELVEILSIKLEPLNLVDQQLEPLFEAKEFDKEFESTQEYREKVLLWQFRAKKKINELSKVQVVYNTCQSTLTPTREIEHFSNTDNIRIKVPKYHIAKFYGDDVSKWLTFWNSFETAVHKNEALNKVDKFNYLKAHLGGSALNTVDGLPISAEAYDEAIQLLKDRFGNTETLIEVHMNKILMMKPLRNSNDIRSFRKFVDNCNVQLRSLDSLGVTPSQYGSILCPMILKLIPSDLVLEYNKSPDKKAGSDIKQLLSFITHALTAREQTFFTNSADFEFNRHKHESKPVSYRDRNRLPYNQGQNRINHTASELFTSPTPAAEKMKRVENVCIFCDMTHSSESCRSVMNLSLEERKNIVKRKGACFNCLKIDKHLSRNCINKKARCEYCNGSHNKFFCFKQQKEKGSNDKEIESTDLSNQSRAQVFLQTLVVIVKNNNSEQLVRLILDSGSQKSYISKYLANIMGFESIGKETITHGLFGGRQMTQIHNKYSIELCSQDNKFSFVTEVLDQKNICMGVSNINDRRLLQKLKQSNVIISDYGKNDKLCFEKDANEIHILLGSDILGKLLTGEIKQLSGGLTAVKTRLGWTVMGKSNDTSNHTQESCLLVHSLLTNQKRISDLWELDSLGITDDSEKKSKLELQDLAVQHFEDTVSRDNEGRYVVGIPWIETSSNLANNLNLAERRLKNTVKSVKNAGKLSDYERVFSDWEKEGIIERIEPDENNESGKVHYLPHRPIYKENSTTKIRPVFDGSARYGKFCSLNDCIEKGPNLIELIPAILNRFRLGKIGVVSDIRKAFLQIALHNNDKNFLRFLWWEGGDPEKVIVYRHRRVVFGISCSPFLLASVLTYHLKQAPNHLKGIARKLSESMYVDNCVTSVNSCEELESFRQKSKELLALGKFDLRGWRHSDVCGPEFDYEVDHEKAYQSEVPVLGLIWNVKEDNISFPLIKADIDEDFVTKRKILSVAHQIFDPIGVTCPITLLPKLLLQDCWKIKASWDSKLPVEIEKKFKNWKKQLLELENLKIPRKLANFDLKDASLSLQVFCDASKLSYAACVYLRAEKKGEVSCQLIEARSKVAPMKCISIPRLELLACLIGTRLTNSIKKDLHMEDIETIFWSDSIDVLFWIKKEGPWATFVANRVDEIRRLSSKDDWRHVPGSQNPADLPSRGCSTKTLIEKRWWEGPSWIKSPSKEWPKSEQFPNMEIVNSEKKKTIAITAVVQDEEKYYYRYSSYIKLVRITAWMLRFSSNLKRSKSQRVLGHLEPNEIKKAELTLLKQVQEDSFSNDNDKRLNSLQVFKDPDGFLRLKTKIFYKDDHKDFRLPIILPSNHHIVKALIVYKHQELGHSGVQMVMNKLRENYWILKSRKTIKEVIKSCTICNKFSVKPVSVSEGILPLDRVRDANIFEIIGVDLAGPLILKEGNKAWILILTCAVFRAVHFELLTSLSTESFLLGLRRFIARRGKPSIIYADNATNFKGAYRLMGNVSLEKLQKLEELNPISWKFIPPSAPWWGGFWERLIGILKRILRKTLGKSLLSQEEMNTVLCDCESLINSRPLTYVSDEAEDLAPLTPAMFLQEIREVGVPELDQIDEEKLKKRLAYRYRVQKDLRKRFRIEYLGHLREIRKVKNECILKEGDVVLIGEEHTKRQNWNLGRVLKLYRSKDGKFRVALIKTKFGSVLRPVQKLYPLELRENFKSFPCNTNSPLFSDKEDFISANLGADKTLSSSPSDPVDDDGAKTTPKPLRSRYGRIYKKPKKF